MAGRPVQVAIIGAGIGGVAAVACPRRVGIEVRVHEQASRFVRLGAGIQQSPNSVRVPFALGFGIAAALTRYGRTRLDRTAAIQRISARNTWLRGSTNADWVHGHDAWTTPLA